MKKSSILVVEDEAIVAMDIEEQLTRMGYLVAGLSSSGKEAIALAEARRPDLDGYPSERLDGRHPCS